MPNKRLLIHKEARQSVQKTLLPYWRRSATIFFIAALLLSNVRRASASFKALEPDPGTISTLSDNSHLLDKVDEGSDSPPVQPIHLPNGGLIYLYGDEVVINSSDDFDVEVIEKLQQEEHFLLLNSLDSSGVAPLFFKTLAEQIARWISPPDSVNWNVDMVFLDVDIQVPKSDRVDTPPVFVIHEDTHPVVVRGEWKPWGALGAPSVEVPETYPPGTTQSNEAAQRENGVYGARAALGLTTTVAVRLPDGFWILLKLQVGQNYHVTNGKVWAPVQIKKIDGPFTNDELAILSPQLIQGANNENN